MHRRIRVVAALLVLAALGGGFWWRSQHATAADMTGTLSGSGTIEAVQVVITAEVAGRVQELPVAEGETVEAGTVLARIDTTLLAAQLEQARAAVAVVEANLAQLNAGARPEELVAAQAQVDQAQALRDGAAKALDHAKTSPAAAQAETAADGAKVIWDGLQTAAQRQPSLQAQADTASAQYQNALAAITTARAAQATQVDMADAQLKAADAGLAQARARLEIARSPIRQEQIAVVQAQVEQARAAQHQIELQLEKATLTSPRAGIVLNQTLHEGEQAMPGGALMTIGALDTVRITVYIGETDIGRVRQGQQATIAVDSFPGRIFKGTVSYISPEAQFTPRNVQTQDERATTVFAVRVEVPNADHALKPGMPADATIIE